MMSTPITVATTDRDLVELLSSEENMCSVSGRNSNPYLGGGRGGRGTVGMGGLGKGTTNEPN